MGSIFPDITIKPNLGFPSILKSSQLFHDGCEIIPTVYPLCSSTREIIACPKLGWSTYASPITYTKSSRLIPLKSKSFLEIGKNLFML